MSVSAFQRTWQLSDEPRVAERRKKPGNLGRPLQGGDTMGPSEGPRRGLAGKQLSE